MNLRAIPSTGYSETMKKLFEDLPSSMILRVQKSDYDSMKNSSVSEDIYQYGPKPGRFIVDYDEEEKVPIPTVKATSNL